MGKKSVLLFLGLILFASSVYAACSSAHNIVLRLSDPSNAHVALGNVVDPRYADLICYENFFSANVGLNPWDCADRTPLLYLSGLSNAHLSTTQKPGFYQTPLCFADLICQGEFDVNNNITCRDSGDKLIFRMNNWTNSHASFAALSTPNINNSYPIKMCCTTEQTIANSDYFWENEAGRPIISARINETVTAKAKDYGGSSTDTFDIYSIGSPSNTPIISSAPGVIVGGDGGNLTYSWDISLNETLIRNLASSNMIQFKVGTRGLSRFLSVTYCGDGVTNGGESCDNGAQNGVAGNNCDVECKFIGAVCGNGLVELPEQCDNGLQNGNISSNSSFCTSNCRLPLQTSGAIWADLSGNRISRAKEGDTVMMILFTGASGSKNFTIYDNANNVIRRSQGISENGNAIGYWQIPSESLLARATGNTNFSKIKFRIDGNVSNDLSLSFGQDDDPVRVNMIGPDCGTITQIRKNLTVNFSVLDGNDLIVGNVTIDGVKKYEFSGRGRSFSFVHNFSTPGTSQIRVYAETTTGAKKTRASAISNVIVPGLNGDYTASCISSPVNYQYISGDYARFDARTSKAVSVTNWNNDPPVSTPKRSSDVTYSWKFSDGRTHSVNGDNTLSQQFFKYFGSYGDNWAELKVEV